MLGDEADLARRRACGIDHQMRLDQRLGGECPHYLRARVILADDPDEGAMHAERGEIAGDVAAAADHQLAARHRQDRCRRLGRDARDLAVDEVVKHQIADAKNRRFLEPRKLQIDTVHLRCRPPMRQR